MLLQRALSAPAAVPACLLYVLYICKHAFFHNAIWASSGTDITFLVYWSLIASLSPTIVWLVILGPSGSGHTRWCVYRPATVEGALAQVGCWAWQGQLEAGAQ